MPKVKNDPEDTGASAAAAAAAAAAGGGAAGAAAGSGAGDGDDEVDGGRRLRILLVSGDAAEAKEGNVALLSRFGDVTRCATRDAGLRALRRGAKEADLQGEAGRLTEPPFHAVVVKLGVVPEPKAAAGKDAKKDKKKGKKGKKSGAAAAAAAGGGRDDDALDDDDSDHDDEATDAGVPVLTAAKRLPGVGGRTFGVVLSWTAAASARRRLALCEGPEGANMVTADAAGALCTVMGRLARQWGDVRAAQQQLDKKGKGSGEKYYHCDWCDLGGLTEDSLVQHVPMFHTRVPNAQAHCPICDKDCTRSPLGVHLFNKHGPVSRGEEPGDETPDSKLYAFALVVCRNPANPDEFLAVDEFCGQGLWLPGGRVDCGETLQEAALRETLEEAGVRVELKGILKIQYRPRGGHVRLRIIFYAEPVETTPPQMPMSIPDYESAGATWVNWREISDLTVRGHEPLTWFPYVGKGGTIHPMDLLSAVEM